LCNRLEQNFPGAAPEYHLRAAVWFEKNGFAADAVRHVLAARDFERAALLIERVAESAIKRSEISAFLKWVQALPEEVMYKHPALCAYYAWALLLSGGSFSEVETWLEEAEREPGIASGRAAALRSMVSVFKGDLKSASKLSHQAVDELPDDDVFLRGVVAWNNGLTQTWGGDIERGMRSMAEAAEIGQNTGSPLITVVALSHLAEINMLLGRLNEAESLYRRALELGVDEEGQPLPIAGMAFIGFGDLSRERNNLNEAMRLIELGLELSERWGKIGTLDGYICLARLKAAQGDLNGAFAEMENAQRLALKFDATEMDDVMVAAYQTRIWVSGGNLRDSEEWAERRRLRLHKILDDSPTLDEGGSLVNIFLRTLENLTLTYLLIAQKRLEEAFSVLEAICRTAGDRGLNGFWIEAQALMAAVLWMRDEFPQAFEILEEALRLAAAQGYVHVFINIDGPMRSLLEGYKMRVAGQQIENHDEDAVRLSAYTDKLLDAFKGYARSKKDGSSVIIDPAIQEPEIQRQSGLIEPLSAREFEVLVLVAEGCTNQEIANRLFIALSTVKTHLNHVYRKLGVSKRTQAVAKARDFNLI
jgi:LuxR family maltose regulon positive regulatory protein